MTFPIQTGKKNNPKIHTEAKKKKNTKSQISSEQKEYCCIAEGITIANFKLYYSNQNSMVLAQTGMWISGTDKRTWKYTHATTITNIL